MSTATINATLQLLDIYIYIYREREREIGSSYTWCNFIRVTPFLKHWFVLDLRVKKHS